jgi:hypothetical protein
VSTESCACGSGGTDFLGLRAKRRVTDLAVLMRVTARRRCAASATLRRRRVHAFDILRQVLSHLHRTAAPEPDRIDLDALFVWSSMHGLADAINGDAIEKLDLTSGLLDQATAHIMQMVGRALSD